MHIVSGTLPGVLPLTVPEDLSKAARQQSLPPCDNDCYVLVNPETKESITIDAPSEPDRILHLAHSITTKLFILPDDTIVHPGHGSGTVLGTEKQNYAVFAGKPHDPTLSGDVTWTG